MPIAQSTLNLTCTTEGCSAIADAVASEKKVTFSSLQFYTDTSLDPQSTTYSDLSSYTAILTMSPLQVVIDSTSTPNTVKISGFYSGQFGDGSLSYNIHTVAMCGSYNGNNILVALDSRTVSDTIYSLQGNGNIAIDVLLTIDDSASTAAIQVSSIDIFPIPATTSVLGGVVLASASDIANKNDGTSIAPKVPTPSAVKEFLTSNVTSIFSTNQNSFTDEYYYENSSVWHSFSNIDFTKPTLCEISIPFRNYTTVSAAALIDPVSEWEEAFYGEGPSGASYVAGRIVTANSLKGYARLSIYANEAKNQFAVRVESSLSNSQFELKIESGNLEGLDTALTTKRLGTTSLFVDTLNAKHIEGEVGTLKSAPALSGALFFGAYQTSSGDNVSISRGTILDSGYIFVNIINNSGSFSFADDSSKITLSANNTFIALNTMTAGSSTYSLGLFMKA